MIYKCASCKEKWIEGKETGQAETICKYCLKKQMDMCYNVFKRKMARPIIQGNDEEKDKRRQGNCQIE